MVSVEHRVEDLRLNGVEVVKGEQASILGVLQSSCGERLEVEEVGVWGVDLRKDEVLKGDWCDTLCTHPAVGDCPHVVLRRKVLKDGDGEHHLLWCPTDDLEEGGGKKAGRMEEGGRGGRREEGRGKGVRRREERRKEEGEEDIW